ASSPLPRNRSPTPSATSPASTAWSLRAPAPPPLPPSSPARFRSPARPSRSSAAATSPSRRWPKSCRPEAAVMRAAGIRRYSDPVARWRRPGPGALRPEGVLVEVRWAGVGTWDEIARTGGGDRGRQPPMALGVEAAGVVARTGGAVTGLAAGDRVMTHSLPLRAQGGWAEWFVAAAAAVAAVPDAVPFEVAAALPVPALTADQVLRDALGARPGATVLVNGASGVTGMLLVALARHLGAEVIATAGAHSAARVAAVGAAHVLDRRSPDWPRQARALTGGRGADLAANAAPGGAARALGAVKDGAR